LAYRELPRRNEEVNQVWMCDEGRLTHHETNDKRLEWARTGRAEEAANVGPGLAIEQAAKLLKPLSGKAGLGIYVSAQCTLEEAASAFALGERLGASKYFVGGKPAGQGDDFLIRADKNPNTRGVQLAARAFGVRTEELPAAGGLGVGALLAFRTDGLDAIADSLHRLEVFVAIAQNETAAVREAHVALPCSSAYEQDGTLINYYGRLQRLYESVPAKRADALPAWHWAARVLEALGHELSIRSPAGAFQLVAAKAPELAGLSLDQIPDDGVVLPSLLPKEWPKRAPRPGSAGGPPVVPQTAPALPKVAGGKN
jgi:NADH-quinone oxidoreductase subunit G